MKKILKLSMAVLMLSLVYAFGMSTGSETFAASLTIAVAGFSAYSHFSPSMSGVALNAIVIPDFTEKSFEDLEEMSAKEVFEYRKDEHDYHTAVSEKALQDRIVELTKEKATDASTIDKMNETLELLKKENIKFGLQLKKINEGGKNFEKTSNALVQLKTDFEAIKDIAFNRTGKDIVVEGITSKGIVEKADTLRANVINNENALDLTNIGQLGHLRLSMYDMFRKVNMGNGTDDGTVRYYDWDEATTVRAAEMRAEGAVFPESTAKWQKYSKDLKKVGDTLPVSEEFFEDAAMFAAELQMFLMTNVDIIVDYQICYGAGTGENLTGLFTTAPSFAPATVTHVESPTIYDLVKVMAEQITKATGKGSKYRPDFCVMNQGTINKMQLSKDANENYMLPPFVSRDGMSISGITIIQSDVVRDDEILVGDRRYASIYEKGGIMLSRGVVDKQFIEDMSTLKVRKRLLFLVRNIDQTGFVKVTDIDAALAAIDSTS